MFTNRKALRITFLLFSFIPGILCAQFKDVILGVGSGMNNFTGLGGAYAESMVYSKVAARIGGGYGLWGPKISIGPRYYFNYPRGEDVGIAFSYVFGRYNVDKEIQTVADGVQTIQYDFGPTYLIDLVVNHHWLYRKKFRFTVEAGYSIPLNTATIRKNTAIFLETDREKEWLRIKRPGGIMIGASAAYIISFGK